MNSGVDGAGSWRQRLAQIVELVRDMSSHNDPQEMVRSYGNKVRVLLPTDGRVSLSRRGLAAPRFRITRSSTWEGEINPWKEKDRLPLLRGGLFAKLIYNDEAKIIARHRRARGTTRLPPISPGHRSLMAIPMFDQGVALNMVILLAPRASRLSKRRAS